MNELHNPLLQQVEDRNEAGMEPQTREDFNKIVVAGMAAALDKGNAGIMASLKHSKDPVKASAVGAVALVLILKSQAKGIMPYKAMVPASMSLMFRALDFCDRSGIVKIGQPELVRATHIWTDTLFAKLGITKQGLKNAAERVHALTQDPASMEKIRVKSGEIPHPGAPRPPAPGLINGGGV